jgi:hypothetical protein
MGTRVPSSGTKRPWREGDHSPPSSASPPLTRLHGKIYIVNWLMANFRQTIMLKELEDHGPTLFKLLAQQLAIFIVAVCFEFVSSSLDLYKITLKDIYIYIYKFTLDENEISFLQLNYVSYVPCSLSHQVK